MTSPISTSGTTDSFGDSLVGTETSGGSPALNLAAVPNPDLYFDNNALGLGVEASSGPRKLHTVKEQSAESVDNENETRSVQSNSEKLTDEYSVICPCCCKTFTDPKVLACFHSFCKHCLEKQSTVGEEKIFCPLCNNITTLGPDLGVGSLLSDYGLYGLLQKPFKSASVAPENGEVMGQSEKENLTCTGCKSKESVAVAYCRDCHSLLCPNCVMAHQYMHCFEGHRVKDLGEFDAATLAHLLSSVGANRPVMCLSHRKEALRYFCFSCNMPVCSECVALVHVKGNHRLESLQDVLDKQLDCMRALLSDAKEKQRNMGELFGVVEELERSLRATYVKTQSDINQSAALLTHIIEQQKAELIRQLEAGHSAKQVSLAMVGNQLRQTSEKLGLTVGFLDRLLQFGSPTEALVFKKLLETRLHLIFNTPADLQGLMEAHKDLEFAPGDPRVAMAAVATMFGGFKRGRLSKTQPQHELWTARADGKLAPPPADQLMKQLAHLALNGTASEVGSSSASVIGDGRPSTEQSFGGSRFLTGSDSNLATSKLDASIFRQTSAAPSVMDGIGGVSNRWSSEQMEGGVNRWAAEQGVSPGETRGLLQVSTAIAQYNSDVAQRRAAAHSPFLTFNVSPQQLVGGGDGVLGPRPQVKRAKMIYHCKVGEFGVMEGQFTEPSGVATNAQNDIVIADTNNHRIQVFDREGRFRFQFGECGKRDGQLLYPNRVAVNKATGDIVVTERSPTHQIQLFNQYGQFIRKFGASVLQHPRGVTVDAASRVLVIECKVMRVLIFDMFGTVLHKFSCSPHLEFPNSICTNDRHEIFISDNRAHCVKVFNYDGQYLRQIGGEGLTNYPIGVGINERGELVVADNHNNFNLTVFDQDGGLRAALESKVKHAQCFDVALLSDGSVVLASKDYRLYLYRYVIGGVATDPLN